MFNQCTDELEKAYQITRCSLNFNPKCPAYNFPQKKSVELLIPIVRIVRIWGEGTIASAINNQKKYL